MVRLKDKAAPISGAVTGFGRISVLLFAGEGDVGVDVNVEDASDLVAEIEGMCRQALFQDTGEALWFNDVVQPFDGPNPAV